MKISFFLCLICLFLSCDNPVSNEKECPLYVECRSTSQKIMGYGTDDEYYYYLEIEFGVENIGKLTISEFNIFYDAICTNNIYKGKVHRHNCNLKPGETRDILHTHYNLNVPIYNLYTTNGEEVEEIRITDVDVVVEESP